MNEGKEIRFVDLFSGIGGFRLGLERAGGYRCVWSCDNKRYANEVYHRRFKPKRGEHFSGDIRKVNPENIPDYDMLCAGFPCQSFSYAGTRKGFQDTRGTLFFEICRIAEATKPALLLLENVKGLLSNQRGKTFNIILQSLEDLGYWVEWQVFNSRHYVPQNRERVFIIGHLGERGGREVFPIFEYGGIPKTTRDETLPSLTGTDWKGPSKQRASIVVGVETAHRGANMKAGRFSEVSHALDGGNTKAVMLHNIYGGFKEEKPRLFENYSPTLRTPTGGGHLPTLMIADRTRTKAGKGRNLESPKEIANTLTGVDKDNYLLTSFRLRTLTPTECERLQGFQDGWTKCGLSDRQKKDLLGNAVTVNVIELLGRRIMDSVGVDILDKKVNGG